MRCPDCRGSGKRRPFKYTDGKVQWPNGECPTCGGSGAVVSVRQWLPAWWPRPDIWNTVTGALALCFWGAVLYGVWWGMSFVNAETERVTAEQERIELADECVEWSSKSDIGRLLDGPQTAEDSRRTSRGVHPSKPKATRGVGARSSKMLTRGGPRLSTSARDSRRNCLYRHRPYPAPPRPPLRSRRRRSRGDPFTLAKRQTRTSPVLSRSLA
jgi:hypothetical protein